MTGAERQRLGEAANGSAPWRRWGPYLSARQWGTVREDYSADGDAWNYFPHDHARSRVYRWGEDGLLGLCDDGQRLCFALALWNGRDPILKERLFGLTNGEGNHGEDAKECWWPLDSTPTHSVMRAVYRYPHAEFPYAWLTEENLRRGRHDPEFELAHTGVFDDDRFFDVELLVAKASPDDLCIRIDCTNQGPDPAILHLLPTLWFRNTWAWGRDPTRPSMEAVDRDLIATSHASLGSMWLGVDGGSQLLFTDNDTNHDRLSGTPNASPFVKDGINDHVVNGAATVNPAQQGTKAAAWWTLDLAAGETVSRYLRLAPDPSAALMLGPACEEVFEARLDEAREYFEPMACTGEAERLVQRRAIASLMWGKQFYYFDVAQWLDGDPGLPPPPPGRGDLRNGGWRHLNNRDVISMPDAWEYPWYASWDLAFHTVTLAFVDPDFAKQQLLLLGREWYMHPNGQLPAYEWAFDDVNPPIHAWAAWRVFKIDARATGIKDHEFLQRVFHKLLINFTWWVNRKDADGSNVFEGGFLGLDNIGLFDRSHPPPAGGYLDQADATSWMAMYCLNMMTIALELAQNDHAYEDVATKFFEHFLYIAQAMNTMGEHERPLWDDEDGFFYDVLEGDAGGTPLKIRSVVGLVPLFAVTTIGPDVLAAVPGFTARMDWFLDHRPEMYDNVHSLHERGDDDRRLFSVVNPDKLRKLLAYLLDPDEFLSPHGIRSLSRRHAEHPVRLELGGEVHELEYEPAESLTGLFGGNSNWRGPVWFPINYLLIESLQVFDHYLGDDFTVEAPTGSGHYAPLWDVAAELSRRLIALFVPDANGRRPLNGGQDRFDFDPLWKDHIVFPEYFHGDNGAGLGASQQGWTTLVAKLIRQMDAG